METRQQGGNDLRAEPSLQALHQEDVRNIKVKKNAGLHQHLTGLVVGDTAIARFFQESRAAHSATGPQIERLRQ